MDNELIYKINQLNNKLIDCEKNNVSEDNLNILRCELYKNKYKLEKFKKEEIKKNYYKIVNLFYEEIIEYKIEMKRENLVMSHDDIYFGILNNV
uniref:Uncharacterized protein n=1 Tax=viral metagenome TaxID=1070528 RepID=A0A6C0C7G0_9ZZZZ